MFGALLLFEDDFIHIVAISFTSLILTELLMVALTIRTWHWLMALAEVISLGVYVTSVILLRNFFGKVSQFFGLIWFGIRYAGFLPCRQGMPPQAIYPPLKDFFHPKILTQSKRITCITIEICLAIMTIFSEEGSCKIASVKSRLDL